MQSTMQDFPLTITHILRHGARVHSEAQVMTFDGRSIRRSGFPAVAARVDRLAAALARLGVGEGDRVGTFCWNHQEHLEAYLAVPCMGAVIHTLNVRLFADQLVGIINHAEDKVVIVDAALVPVLGKLASRLPTVERYIVVGEGDASGLPGAERYEDLLAQGDGSGYPWPDLDERSAAALCYTTGTTGDPKGVAYSHRSILLHALGESAGVFFGLNARDRVMVVAPMFHATGWGLPYAGWWAGADLIFPDRYLQAEPLSRLIEQTRPTLAGAVPTVWADVLRFAESHPVDLSSFRLLICGGSAVPAWLMERSEQRHGVRMLQAWGMTETSPAAAVALPPAGADPGDDMAWRIKTGRPVPGVEMRLCDEGGAELPWDGTSIGEFEVRGYWVTGSYYRIDAPERFHDGWLRTGDVGTMDPLGYARITDRSKDVIKSGGEWVSSVELENALMAHPDVSEAAVIGVADQRWGERPLACVVRREGGAVTPEDLCGFLTDRVSKWWLPERWAFLDAIPKTSVGKFDKVALRSLYAQGKLAVTLR